MVKLNEKISKVFEQKVTNNRLRTLFKIQLGSQIARLRAIGKPNHQAKGGQLGNQITRLRPNCRGKNKFQKKAEQ